LVFRTPGAPHHREAENPFAIASHLIIPFLAAGTAWTPWLAGLRRILAIGSVFLLLANITFVVVE